MDLRKTEVITVRQTANYIWVDPLDLLGEGGGGQVFKCRHLKTGEMFAAKRSTHRTSSDNELEMLKKLNPNPKNSIVKFIDVEKLTPIEDIIIMNYCAGGSLESLLSIPENSCGLTDDELTLFIIDIVESLKFLRGQKLAHFDIKPANILKYVAEDGQTIYQLTDFGTTQSTGNRAHFSPCGTRNYMHPNMVNAYYSGTRPPELDRNSELKVNELCDLWSLGVTIYQVATGSHPFPFSNVKLLFNIIYSKPSGAVSAVLLPDDKFEHSRELPESCRLTPAFRRHVASLIAKLLDVSLSWKFEDLFEWTDEQLEHARFLELFVMSRCTFDRVYFPVLKPERNDYDELVRSYVSVVHKIDKQDCYLFLPFNTRVAASSKDTNRQTSGTKAKTEEKPLLPVATADDLSKIMLSCKTVRVRVALTERGNFVAQLDSLKLTPAGSAKSAEQAPTARACVVAMQTIDVQELVAKKEEAYLKKCEERMQGSNTLISSLEAQTAACRSNAANLSTHTALACSSFRASVALGDAQTLIAACGNYLIDDMKRRMCTLRQPCVAFESKFKQVSTALDTAIMLIDSRVSFVSVLAEAGQGSQSNQPDEFLEQLQSAKAEFSAKQKEIQGFETEIRKFINEYHSVVVEQDKLALEWKKIIGHDYCFVSVIPRDTMDEFPVTLIVDEDELKANIKFSGSVPCSITLQRVYEHCSSVYSSRKKFQNNREIGLPACSRVRLDSEAAAQHVMKHCKVRTVRFYKNFIKWWSTAHELSTRFERIRRMVNHHHGKLNKVLKEITGFRQEERAIETIRNIVKHRAAARALDKAEADRSPEAESRKNPAVLSAATEQLKALASDAEQLHSKILSSIVAPEDFATY